VTTVHETVFRIRRTRDAVNFYQGAAVAEEVRSQLAEAAAPLLARLDELEGELHQTKAVSSKDLLNVPGKLSQRLVSLSGAVGMGQCRPARQMYEVHAQLTVRFEQLMSDAETLFATEVARFAQVVESARLPVMPAR